MIKPKLQAYIEKHLLGMTSLLPPWLAPQSCATSVTFLAFLAMPSSLFSRIARTFPCLADKLSATRMPHVVGGKQIFFPSHFSGDKGQNEIFENSPSVSPAPSFLNFMVQLSCQNPFSSKFGSKLHEQLPSHCSYCHTAPRPRQVWSAKIIWQQEEIPHLLDEDVLCWTSQSLDKLLYQKAHSGGEQFLIHE